ncbi:MAG: 16S rRNA (cytidine(1402)-2'-O)-methyltransferase [Terriglobales bacterium]
MSPEETSSSAGGIGDSREAASSHTLSAAPALYLVGTPIGNLEDITLRALRVLKEVDLIACEDTRHTQKLLNHYGITSRLTSYHEHNELARAAELMRKLEQGTRIALVTDAGMPGISDPGFRLVSVAIEHHIPVIPIPGPSAFLTGLAASGLASDSFRFHGFLPSKRGQRRQILESVNPSDQTDLFYEAPHRIRESLEDIVEVLGTNRQVVIARELTKIHEEFLRGTAGELLNILIAREEIKGEITLLIAGVENSEQGVPPVAVVTIRKRVEQIIAEEKLDEKAALKKVAKERGISKSEAYRELQRSK